MHHAARKRLERKSAFFYFVIRIDHAVCSMQCRAADRGVRTVGEVCLPAIPDCILSRCSCGLVSQEYMTYQLLLCDVLNV
jgi:hypothetical protein